jgi:hypothetical protein
VENILVVAARKPITQVESLLNQLRKPAPSGRREPFTNNLRETDRGFGKLTDAGPSRSAGTESKISLLARSLAAMTADASGVWIGQYQLVNQGY